MSKLKTLLLEAKLMKLTGLKARTRNATGWSSTFDMLVRYQQIKDPLHILDWTDVDDLSLHTTQDCRVNDLVARLKNLESVTKSLQEHNPTMADVRALFDCVMDDYYETTDGLTAASSIVHSPVFKSAVVKVQGGNGNNRTHEEHIAVSTFEISTTGNAYESNSLSYAERALKRQNAISANDRQYMDISFLLPASKICERLFSKAGHVVNVRRMAIVPFNLESQLLLHLNNDFWSVDDSNALTA